MLFRSMGAATPAISVLHVPLRVTGMPADSSVLLDRADIRITGLDGATLYEGKSTISRVAPNLIFDARFEVRAGRDDSQVHSVDQRIYLPAEVYVRLADRQVRMAIDYSLTLFGPAGTYSLPTTSSREPFRRLGL